MVGVAADVRWCTCSDISLLSKLGYVPMKFLSVKIVEMVVKKL